VTTHPTLLAIAEVIWEAQQAQQATQAPPPPPETTAELVASCWASQARLDAAQARADAALARLVSP
jgi:hypothetical protein